MVNPYHRSLRSFDLILNPHDNWLNPHQNASKWMQVPVGLYGPLIDAHSSCPRPDGCTGADPRGGNAGNHGVVHVKI